MPLWHPCVESDRRRPPLLAYPRPRPPPPKQQQHALSRSLSHSLSAADDPGGRCDQNDSRPLRRCGLAEHLAHEVAGHSGHHATSPDAISLHDQNTFFVVVSGTPVGWASHGASHEQRPRWCICICMYVCMCVWYMYVCLSRQTDGHASSHTSYVCMYVRTTSYSGGYDPGGFDIGGTGSSGSQ